MIKVRETLYKDRQEPLIVRKQYEMSKKDFIELLKNNYGVSNKIVYDFKNTNEIVFSYAGIKRKIEIMEDTEE